VVLKYKKYSRQNLFLFTNITNNNLMFEISRMRKDLDNTHKINLSTLIVTLSVPKFKSLSPVI